MSRQSSGFYEGLQPRLADSFRMVQARWGQTAHVVRGKVMFSKRMPAVLQNGKQEA